MEWLKELLKGKGIEVSEDIFADVQKEFPKHYIPKNEYNSKLEEIKGLNAQLSERDKQLDGLKKSTDASEELKKQIATLQGENKTAKENYEKQLGELKFNSALEKALIRAKAIDSDLVKVKLDMEKIKLDDSGKLTGLDEQLGEVQKNFSFLFEPSEVKLGGAKAAEGGAGTGAEDDPFLQGFNSNT